MAHANEVQPLLARTLLLAVMLGWSGCGSEQGPAGPLGGRGGSKGTGGASGGSGGSRANPGSGGNGGAGTGGMDAAPAGLDAAPGLPADAAPGDVATGDLAGDSSFEAGAGAPADGPPMATRPDAMGAPCATGQRYAFTIRPFTSQAGTFTAYFTVTPGRAPTNSVIGLSDGQKYLHDDYAAIVRFGTSGNLDARNGAGYTSLTPIRYMVTDYHFRLVINVPARTYSAYVSYGGMPEITIGTDLAFRDSAGTPAKLNYWGVEAINPHVTRVCNFLVQ